MTGRHLILDFIRETTTQAQFARDVECSESHLALFLQGKRGLSVTLARRMSEVTQGKVPLQALVSPEIAELMPQVAAE